MKTPGRILIAMVAFLCLLQGSGITECESAERTLARLSFWVPPERMIEFEAAYGERVVPILRQHGFAESPQRSRVTVDSVFSRLLALSTSIDLAKNLQAIRDDPDWRETLWELGTTFGTTHRDSLIRYRLGCYYVPAAGNVVSVGKGKTPWHIYDAVDGLAGGGVWSFTQDQDGSLWLSSGGSGISRYDGETFTNFTTEDGIPERRVFSISQGPNGNLWLGTGVGVSRYDGETFTNFTFTTEDGIPRKYVVWWSFQDREGNLWFATRGGGARCYDGKSFTSFTVDDGLAHNDVRSVYQDRERNLWFTTGMGVSRYDGSTFTSYTVEDGLGSNNVHSVIQDREGNLWFGTIGGVSRYDGESWTTFTTEDGLVDNRVGRSILADSEGNLWFGTFSEGVSRYDGESFTTFSAEDGLAHNDVVSMFQDREGNLWFGYYYGGLSRYAGLAFTTFTADDGLGHHEINCMIQDRDGNLWFGTGDGVSRYDGESFTTFTVEDGLPHRIVNRIIQDRSGNLWFGTASGVSRYDGKGLTTFTTEDGLAGDRVDAIYEDREGNIWFWNSGPGSRRGVSRYDGKEFATFTIDDGLPHNKVRMAIQDWSGILWFATSRGVSRYDGKNFATFTTEDGLAHNNVGSILQDRDGNLWFTTGGGVSCYDGHTWTTFTTEDGLAHNNVESMYQDQDGNLWFTTHFGGGVSCYDGQVFQTLIRQDGLGSNTVRSVLQDREKVLWFSTINGATRYRRPEPSPPPILVDAVVADRRYGKVSEIKTPSSEGLIAFEFHGVSFKTRPEAMVYRYRLKGHDDNWKNTRKRRVEYQDLPTGEYTFEVLAVDRDLAYSEKPATVDLYVYYQPMSSSVRISEVNVQDVFASFYKTYAEQSIGSALVTNDDPNPVEATVSFYIPDLMGRPTEQTVSLERQSARRVPLHAILNPDILDLKGGMPVQVEVALSCEVGEQTISVKESRNITVHGRGALKWDTLGRAAAFVTPEDGSVSAFARGLYETYRHQVKGKRIDGNIPTAMLIFEALNAHGIKYAKDTSTPYSQVRTDRSAVDHIQYPSELLQSRLGDCDDCTVLYCALLENLDIPTAFVDAPSHILMMFDSGVSIKYGLGFSLGEDRYILRTGRFWIPVEVTKLGEGSFMEAWELGAKTCSRLASEGALHVTDVRQVWAEYPYALPSVEGEYQFPDPEQFERGFFSGIAELQKLREDYLERRYIRPLMENPGDHRCRMEFARTQVESADYNGAISTLMPLLSTELKAEAYYLIGYAYAGRKDYEAAVTYFEKALECDPENEDYERGLEVLKGIVKRRQDR